MLHLFGFFEIYLWPLRPVDFKPETSYLKLSNYKARKILKWHPRWSLNKSLNKILEWNNNAKSKGYEKVCEDQIKNYLS